MLFPGTPSTHVSENPVNEAIKVKASRLSDLSGRPITKTLEKPKVMFDTLSMSAAGVSGSWESSLEGSADARGVDAGTDASTTLVMEVRSILDGRGARTMNVTTSIRAALTRAMWRGSGRRAAVVGPRNVMEARPSDKDSDNNECSTDRSHG